MSEIKTQPNEKRCHRMTQTHKLSIPPCCPMSGNPLDGSFIEITYQPDKLILEVASLRSFVDSYKGGKGEIRSMEGMIQDITRICANTVRVMVHSVAMLNINPGQSMKLECAALVTE
jgi:NADPH-dependent 7-cyano-7-deazaguanine reductase QueF